VTIDAAYIQANGPVVRTGDFSILPPRPAAANTAQPAVTSTPKASKTVEMNGSGFIVSSNGHVVTNHHVVNGCVGDIQGKLTTGGTMTLRVISSDETNDLALLQTPMTFTEVATIRGMPIHSGDSVVAIGFPFHGLLTSDFTVTTGIISSLSGILNDTRYLQISAPVQPGNSGGPLLDLSGNVVGVVAEKFNALKFAKASGGTIPENMNFAIKTGAVRDFLDNGVVSYKTSESAMELKTADIASRARAYTVLISCTGNG
jgi:S1-C subfamily serine protease